MADVDPTPDASSEVDVTGIDLRRTLRFVSFLAGDPTYRLGAGEYVRATRTPHGPATVHVAWSDGPTALARAWGPAADWLIGRIDGFLGRLDDPTGFDPEHRALRTVWERNQGRRVNRTGTLWHDIAGLILQQRVRTEDAGDSWRRMVRGLGEQAPGPFELMLPPSHEVIGSLSYKRFHPFGIERSRAETLRRTAREMPRLEHLVDLPFEAVEPRLRSIPGIGPWTTAGLESLTWGSADAVIVGDVKLPQLVCWFLAREEYGDDDRMLELLGPFRPHRYRVIQMAYESGVRVPRRRPTRYGINPIRNR